MTLRLWQKQGGYDPDLGWTGDPADVPTVDQPATASVPDKLRADGASESHAWLSLADHTADVMAETNELVQAFELSDRPEGMALSEAAPWHDVRKASIRWKNAIWPVPDEPPTKGRGMPVTGKRPSGAAIT